MNTYYAYDTESTQSVSETLTITNGQVQLRHIPRQSSVTIPGFIETTALVVPAGRFRVDYFDSSSEYREASRRIYFNAADNGKSISIGYNAVGTPVTAADMNEIKNHMANSTLHGSGTHPITAAQVDQIIAHMANTSIHGGGSSSSGGNMNFLGSYNGYPSAAKVKGNVIYCDNGNPTTSYFSLYDGSKWIEFPHHERKTHVKVVTGYNFLDFTGVYSVIDQFPDWCWNYADSGCSEILLPAEIQFSDQILELYNKDGVQIAFENYYVDNFIEFADSSYSGVNKCLRMNGEIENLCGLNESVKNSGTIIIKYEI